MCYILGTKNTKAGTEMPKMREEVFEQVFRAGAVASVRVTVINGRAVINYRTGEGIDGCIHTKRGQPKEYRIETALRFLRAVGLAAVEVDMSAWSPESPGLF